MSINGDFGEDFIHYARSSRYQRQNASQITGSIRRPQSTTFSVTGDVLTEDEIYYFSIINLTPRQAKTLLSENPPPPEFYDMDAVVKAGYLFYYSVYKQYFPHDAQIFVKRFYKEFYKYTCENMSEAEALKKICNHTYKEWVRNQEREMSERYKIMHGSTPESRTSLSSYEDIDLLKLDSTAKEPLKFRSHHSIVRFGPGGRLLILKPRESISAIHVDYFKDHAANPSLRRNIDLVERFKGPLIYNETQPHTLQLFIERQIRDIYNSDVYKGNPDSNDTNDCLLIWRLLQMLIKQHGRVSGPDLAQLLIEDNRYKDYVAYYGNKSPLMAQNSHDSANEGNSVLVECTNLLLRGCVDEAINSAIQEGHLFDALILAESLYATRPDKLAAVRTRLMATRSARHPLSTLISVAESKAVPLLASTNTGDGQGWRAHVAILLANLQSQMAYESIYRLGLDLAKKEFNSAADFCFLAVNLLSGYNCFSPPSEQTSYRQHISLINATLPDDNVHAARTSYGWSILDFCATEIFEFALRLSNGGHPTVLCTSPIMLQHRYQYAQMLDSLGGFGESVRAYSQSYCQSQSQQQVPQQVPQVKMYEPVISEPKYTSDQTHFQVQQFPPEPVEVVESVKKPEENIKLEQPDEEINQSIRSSWDESNSQSQQQLPQVKMFEPAIPQSNYTPPQPNYTPVQAHFQIQQFPSESPEVVESFKKPGENIKLKQLDDEINKPLNKSGSASGSRGWLGGIISKVMPSGPNQMILPSDKDIPEEEKIRWDPQLNRYVGGVEEEAAPPPPPMLMPSQNAPVALKESSSVMATSAYNSQVSSRPTSIRRGVNRYSNVFTNDGGKTVGANKSAPLPSMIPNMSAPTTIGFIPMATDTDDQESPFSQATVDPQQQSRETSQETN